MKQVILILVLIAAALAIASGVWVASALLRTLAARYSPTQTDPEEDAADQR
jgi:uncharacterized SAM-binding protein YcdF (DUF218 family)